MMDEGRYAEIVRTRVTRLLFDLAEVFEIQRDAFDVPLPFRLAAEQTSVVDKALAAIRKVAVDPYVVPVVNAATGRRRTRK